MASRAASLHQGKASPSIHNNSSNNRSKAILSSSNSGRSIYLDLSRCAVCRNNLAQRRR